MQTIQCLISMPSIDTDEPIGEGGMSKSTIRICVPCREGRHSACSRLECDCSQNEHQIV
jgi:hypothetical protein